MKKNLLMTLVCFLSIQSVFAAESAVIKVPILYTSAGELDASVRIEMGSDNYAIVDCQSFINGIELLDKKNKRVDYYQLYNHECYDILDYAKQLKQDKKKGCLIIDRIDHYYKKVEEVEQCFQKPKSP